MNTSEELINNIVYVIASHESFDFFTNMRKNITDKIENVTGAIKCKKLGAKVMNIAKNKDASGADRIKLGS